jgi:hypothetical protein
LTVNLAGDIWAMWLYDSVRLSPWDLIDPQAAHNEIPFDSGCIAAENDNLRGDSSHSEQRPTSETVTLLVGPSQFSADLGGTIKCALYRTVTSGVVEILSWTRSSAECHRMALEFSGNSGRISDDLARPSQQPEMIRL